MKDQQMQPVANNMGTWQLMVFILDRANADLGCLILEKWHMVCVAILSEKKKKDCDLSPQVATHLPF